MLDYLTTQFQMLKLYSFEWNVKSVTNDEYVMISKKV
jgi:hypothetical protein